MGFMSKIAEAGANMVAKDAGTTVSLMPKPDGKLHAAVVGVKSGMSLGSLNTALDTQATQYLDAVLQAMQEAGMQVMGVSSAKSDTKDLSFLITYR